MRILPLEGVWGPHFGAPRLQLGTPRPPPEARFSFLIAKMLGKVLQSYENIVLFDILFSFCHFGGILIVLGLSFGAPLWSSWAPAWDPKAPIQRQYSHCKCQHLLTNLAKGTKTVLCLMVFVFASIFNGYSLSLA